MPGWCVHFEKIGAPREVSDIKRWRLLKALTTRSKSAGLRHGGHRRRASALGGE